MTETKPDDTKPAETPAEGGAKPAEGGEQKKEGETKPAEGATPPAEGEKEGETKPAEDAAPPAEGAAEGGAKPAEGGEQKKEGAAEGAAKPEEPVDPNDEFGSPGTMPAGRKPVANPTGLRYANQYYEYLQEKFDNQYAFTKNSKTVQAQLYAPSAAKINVSGNLKIKAKVPTEEAAPNYCEALVTGQMKMAGSLQLLIDAILSKEMLAQVPSNGMKPKIPAESIQVSGRSYNYVSNNPENLNTLMKLNIDNPVYAWNLNFNRDLNNTSVALDIAAHVVTKLNELIDYVITNNIMSPNNTFRAKVRAIFAPPDGQHIYNFAHYTLMLPALVNYFASNKVNDQSEHASRYVGIVEKGSGLLPQTTKGTSFNHEVKWHLPGDNIRPVVAAPYAIVANDALQCKVGAYNYPFTWANADVGFKPTIVDVVSPPDKSVIDNIPVGITGKGVLDKYIYEDPQDLQNLILGSVLNEYSDLSKAKPDDDPFKIDESAFDEKKEDKEGEAKPAEGETETKTDAANPEEGTTPPAEGDEQKKEGEATPPADAAPPAEGGEQKKEGFNNINFSYTNMQADNLRKVPQARFSNRKVDWELEFHKVNSVTPHAVASGNQNVSCEKPNEWSWKKFKKTGGCGRHNYDNPSKSVKWNEGEFGGKQIQNDGLRCGSGCSKDVYNTGKWYDNEGTRFVKRKLQMITNGPYDTGKVCKSGVNCDSEETDKRGVYKSKALSDDLMPYDSSEGKWFIDQKYSYKDAAGGYTEDIDTNHGSNIFLGADDDMLNLNWRIKGAQPFYAQQEIYDYTGEFDTVAKAGKDRASTDPRLWDSSKEAAKRDPRALWLYHTIRPVRYFNDNVFDDWLYLVLKESALKKILSDIDETLKTNPELILLNKVNSVLGPYLRENKAESLGFMDIPLGSPFVYLPKTRVLPYKGYYADFKVDNTIDPDNVKYDTTAFHSNIINRVRPYDESDTNDKNPNYVALNYLDNVYTGMSVLCKQAAVISKDMVLGITLPRRGCQLFGITGPYYDKVSNERVKIFNSLIQLMKMTDESLEPDKETVFITKEVHTYPRLVMTIGTKLTAGPGSAGDSHKELTGAMGVHMPIINVKRTGTSYDVMINTSSETRDNLVAMYVTLPGKVPGGNYSAKSNSQLSGKTNTDVNIISVDYDGNETKELPAVLQARFVPMNLNV